MWADYFLFIYCTGWYLWLFATFNFSTFFKLLIVITNKDNLITAISLRYPGRNYRILLGAVLVPSLGPVPVLYHHFPNSRHFLSRNREKLHWYPTTRSTYTVLHSHSHTRKGSTSLWQILSIKEIGKIYNISYLTNHKQRRYRQRKLLMAWMYHYILMRKQIRTGLDLLWETVVLGQWLVTSVSWNCSDGCSPTLL